MSDLERRSIASRVRGAYRFWATDERFSWGARNQFVVMAPVCAIIAVIGVVTQQWLAAAVFALGAVYMGNWLLKDRRRRSR